MEMNIANIQDFIALLRKDREKVLSLPPEERYRRIRIDGVEKLLYLGYITSDEADRYREQLSKLPTDRRGLVIAYFLSGYYNSDIIDSEGYESIKGAIISLNERKKKLPTDRIIDVCNSEEIAEYKIAIATALYKSELQRAESFVDAKRKRLREALFPFVRMRAASALLDEPVKEKGETLDRTPYLRDIAIENGYRQKAKIVNETDRQALDTASLYYLNLIELAILNGEGYRRRKEVYPNYLSDDEKEYIETLYYEDELDEALTELSNIYGVLDEMLIHFYNEGTPKKMIDLIKKFLSIPITYRNGKFVNADEVEEDLFTCRLLNSKFKYLINERR